MSNAYLGTTSPAALLPHSIATDKTVADVAEALAPLLHSSVAAIGLTLVKARLMNGEASMLPSMRRIAALDGGLAPVRGDLLDLLAWEYHVDGYGAASTDAERLALVRESIAIHRRRGTRWAVETALNAAVALAGYAVITEWQDYDGDPYHFRVRLVVTGDALSSALMGRASTVVESTKSVRSHCDGYTVESAQTGTLIVAGAVTAGVTLTIHPAG